MSPTSPGPGVLPAPGLHSTTLAAWVRAWRTGLVSYDDVLDEVGSAGLSDPAGPEVEHLVRAADGTVLPLAQALTALSRLDPAEVRVVLPAPGDPRGLPGPGPFSSAALLAGEGVVLGPEGWVPVVAGLGPDGRPDPDRWYGVGWEQHPIGPAGPGGLPPLHQPAPDLLTVAEADHDLTLALAETTDALRELGGATGGRLPPQLMQGLGALRADAAGPALPPGYGARARRLAARAATITNVVTLAGADGSGGALAAVSVQDAVARTRALRPLATAARRALGAAVNAPLEP